MHFYLRFAAPQCVMSEVVYQSFYGLPLPATFGYVELDGVDGETSADETVMFGDEVETGVVVLVDSCNTWCEHYF